MAEEVTGSKFGFIGEIGPDRLHHDIAMSDPGWELCELYDKTGHRRPPGNFAANGLYGHVIATGKSLLSNSPSEHPYSIGTPAGHPPLTAFLGVPLKRGGRTVGMIAMGNRDGGYGDDQRRALEDLAPAMVQAFDRKRAEEALRNSERRATAELGLSNTLLRAAETLSSSMQIDTVLDRLAELLVEAVGSGRLVVLLWDHGRGEMSVALSKGGASFPVGTVWPRDDVHAIPFVSRLLTDHRVRTIDFEGADMPPEVRRITAQIGMRLALAVPIVAKGELFGYVGLDERDGRREFSGREIGLAKAICDQAAAALDNARLYQQEHDVAQALRAALLKLPDEIPGLTFAHHYRPAVQPAHVGGDFYDLFELDHGHVGVVVGDISGKGIEAAVLTSLVKNTIRAHATEKGKTPAEVLALTNTVLTRETAVETFATVFFAMLDRRDGRLVYCNAGHPASVVARRDASVAVLPATSPLLGAFAEFTYQNAEAFLACDDLLFLYTDGLTEARQRPGPVRRAAALRARWPALCPRARRDRRAGDRQRRELRRGRPARRSRRPRVAAPRAAGSQPAEAAAGLTPEPHHPQMRRAVSAMTRNLAFSCSTVRSLPTIEVAKPHCGERARRSSAMQAAASRMRSSSPATVSRRPCLVVTRPSTTTLSSGTARSGSNPPDRSSSYSSRKRCTFTLPKS